MCLQLLWQKHARRQQFFFTRQEVAGAHGSLSDRGSGQPVVLKWPDVWPVYADNALD